jgi:predicted nucleic acid-binding protein
VSAASPQYCLDANFFIQAWNNYYSPEFCQTYWDVINKLAAQEIIFIASQVRDEIYKTDDELKEWLKESQLIIKPTTEKVAACLKEIYAKDPKHRKLTDNTRSRSIADPWVIAHAMNENAIVVTKENKITEPSSQQVKIPNECENMDVKWLNDFDFIKLMNIKFTCDLK